MSGSILQNFMFYVVIICIYLKVNMFGVDGKKFILLFNFKAEHFLLC